jgi:protease-4
MDENASTPTPPPVPPPAPAPPPLSAPLRSAPVPAPRAKSGRGWKIAAVVLAVLLLGSMAVNVSQFFASVLGGAGFVQEAGPHLHEIVLEAGGGNKIAVIPVEGVIMSAGGFGPHDMVRLIEKQLKLAAEDDRVKAVLLKVNSPGGEVLASDDIYRAIEKFQSEHKKPVVASMGSLAASGGYYVSAPCRWIVANELTITGSIGVILHSYNVRGLMNKVGVRPVVIKSGRFKDMLGWDRELEKVTPEERAEIEAEEKMLQKLIGQTFDRFKTVVDDGRRRAQERNQSNKADTGRALSGRWADYADGRILSGREAYELGFVDELGNWETAVKRARALAGIDKASLVTYQAPFNFLDAFSLFGQSETKSVKLDLGLDLPRLPAGRLYYLSANFLP